MYKPAAQRRWGYFALPILHDDRLVGKVDAKADRKACPARERDSRGRQVHPGHDQAVQAEFEDLASWLGVDAIEWG